MKIAFIKSAVHPEDYPPPELPEIGIVGRSNAGKSSLINALAGKKIAKVSAQPGKTRLLNFFICGQHYRLVDMPGYGFASRSHSEINDWKSMIENYLLTRSNLVGLLLIMDIRRNWSADEQLLLDWLKPRNLPMAVVLTKSDKVKQGERVKKARQIRAIEGIASAFVVSNLKRTGVEDLEEEIFRLWIQQEESQ